MAITGIGSGATCIQLQRHRRRKVSHNQLTATFGGDGNKRNRLLKP